MKTVSATDARSHLFNLIEQAGNPGVFIAIKHRDLPDVVLMSIDEFEGWQETLEIMSDPDLMQDIHAAMRERKTVSLEDLERREHAAARDVRRHPQKKGRKTVQKASRAR
ncbi:type II toxin-antitoxin system Phd/YefM family antitoxin [Candidatus Peregrinibacteria bacterium]|nr:type II toxin-antitoxin system Phd/YefM family antitoxin [Candidatus Peregrinibacteria bacterium]